MDGLAAGVIDKATNFLLFCPLNVCLSVLFEIIVFVLALNDWMVDLGRMYCSWWCLSLNLIQKEELDKLLYVIFCFVIFMSVRFNRALKTWSTSLICGMLKYTTHATWHVFRRTHALRRLEILSFRLLGALILLSGLLQELLESLIWLLAAEELLEVL